MKKIRRYVLDTEFVEGFTSPIIGRRQHYIDLISIAIVDLTTGRHFEAVSKDFNLNRAWNAHDKVLNKAYPMGPEYNRIYFVREQVLRPIFRQFYKPGLSGIHHDPAYTKRNLRRVIKSIGRSLAEIEQGIRSFIYSEAIREFGGEAWSSDQCVEAWLNENELRFYADYGSYDWVVFCSIFGKMMDLPAGFPMFVRDIQQILSEKGIGEMELVANAVAREDEHLALGDARHGARVLREIRYTVPKERRLDI